MDAEHVRPFVGELLWSMFFVYRAFKLRVAVILEHGLKKGEMPYWYDDNGIQQFIRLLFTEDEIGAIERYPIARFGKARQLAESKIIAEMNRIIAGHRSADSGLEQARKMLRAVAEVEANR